MVEYVNTNIYYIKNEPNYVYGGAYMDALNKDRSTFKVQTGWHFIPNSLWSNWLSPKQFYDLVSNHSEICLDKVECTVQNLIPLTDNLAIGQDTTFMSFNNTIYALAFEDQNRETEYSDENTNLLWREGVTFQQTADGAAVSVKGKNYLPHYIHNLPCTGKDTGALGLLGWDPLIHANTFQELRPGKNSITFTWKATEHHWKATAYFNSFHITDDIGSKQGYVEQTYNFGGYPLTPPGLIRQSVPANSDVLPFNWGSFVPNHYYENPIPNWFIKMIPIYDTKNNLMKHEAQVVITRKIYFKVKPRIGGSNFPQIGAGYVNVDKYQYTLKDGPSSEWYSKKAIAPSNKTQYNLMPAAEKFSAK